MVSGQFLASVALLPGEGRRVPIGQDMSAPSAHLDICTAVLRSLWYRPTYEFVAHCANLQGLGNSVRSACHWTWRRRRRDVRGVYTRRRHHAITAAHSQCISMEAVKSPAKNILCLRLQRSAAFRGILLGWKLRSSSVLQQPASAVYIVFFSYSFCIELTFRNRYYPVLYVL